MRKGIVLLLSLVMVFVMSAASFAADQEPAIIEDPIEEYSSVAGIDASLNLYSDRGEIIGKFRIETNCIALDDKEE